MTPSGSSSTSSWIGSSWEAAGDVAWVLMLVDSGYNTQMVYNWARGTR
jgi:hypothetical protein